MGSDEEGDKQLRHNVDHECEKGDPNQTKCQVFTLEIDSPELPDDHDRRKDFDERVQAKACKGHRTGGIGSQDDNDHPNHIPSQGDIFQQ
jgi:hypothetical protein